jgi:hypothetical protein
MGSTSKVKSVFPVRGIENFTLDELLDARKNSSVDWAGKRQGHRILLKKLEHYCQEMLRPLIDRVLRGGKPLIAVLNSFKAKPAYCGWFCQQLGGYETEPIKVTRPCTKIHPVALLMNALLPSYSDLHTVFTIKQDVENDEHPVDCAGEFVSVDALTSSAVYSSADEFFAKVAEGIPYSGALKVTGLELDFTAYTRSVMLTTPDTGILVVPEPSKTKLFFETLVDECHEHSSRAGYSYQENSDKKTYSVYAWRQKVGTLKASSSAFKVIRHMFNDHHNGAEVSYDTIQKSVLNSAGTVTWSVRNNAFKRNEALFDALFFQDTAKKTIRLKSKSGD